MTSTTVPASSITASKSSSPSDGSAANQKNYSTAAEPFLNGSNTAYMEEMYNAWLQNPASVHVVSIFLNIFN